jgi:hypothetical protein
MRKSPRLGAKVEGVLHGAALDCRHEPSTFSVAGTRSPWRPQLLLAWRCWAALSNCLWNRRSGT